MADLFGNIRHKFERASDRVANELARGQMVMVKARYKGQKDIEDECEAVIKALEDDNNTRFQEHVLLLNLAIDSYTQRKNHTTKQKIDSIAKEARPQVEAKLKKEYGVKEEK